MFRWSETTTKCCDGFVLAHMVKQNSLLMALMMLLVSLLLLLSLLVLSLLSLLLSMFLAIASYVQVLNAIEVAKTSQQL